LAAAGGDDPEAWLAAHGTALYRHALLHLRDPHKAEEAVQDTLVAALQARERFAGQASVRTWLIGILKHKIVDTFRREAREAPLDDPDRLSEADIDTDAAFKADGHWAERLADWGNPEDTLRSKQFLEILQRCLDFLPARLARLFVLREVLEEDTENICQELAITPTNVWTMLYRARMGLRDCLARNWAG
jgi:RNA polymerase sigma-70 factor (ECF subfamily)